MDCCRWFIIGQSDVKRSRIFDLVVCGGIPDRIADDFYNYDSVSVRVASCADRGAIPALWIKHSTVVDRFVFDVCLYRTYFLERGDTGGHDFLCEDHGVDISWYAGDLYVL